MQIFLVSGRKTAGNGLLGAGGEPLGRQALGKSGSADLYLAHLPSRSMPSARRSPAGRKLPPSRIRTALPKFRRAGPALPQVQFQAGPWP